MRLFLAAPAALWMAGCTVAVDGRIGADEWASASQVMAGEARIYSALQQKELLVAVRLPAGAFRYVDMYVQDATGGVLNLHTSMRQGERVLSSLDRDAGPAFTWEPTSGWEGSTAPKTGAPRTAPFREWLASYEGYEMRIPLSLLGPPPWRVRYEVRDFELKETDWVYPAASTLAAPSTWAELRPPH